VADPNRALFESVVRLLAPVLDELVFVGGCTTGLFITDPAAGGIRPTEDVDAIVDVTSYAKYAALPERLRALGLAEDTTPGAPLCRWRRDELIVDVMPVDERILGFSNRWYPAAIEGAQTIAIGDQRVRVVTPTFFIATKLEAFHGRGGGGHRREPRSRGHHRRGRWASGDHERGRHGVDGRPPLYCL
jgi:hypothetical protein